MDTPPGCVGVFARSALPLAFRCPYPGWCMPSSLHGELHARYHVPTAVQLQARRTLVGEPCALGGLINGAKHRGDAQRVNVAVAWEEAEHRHPTGAFSLCVRPLRPI